MVSSLGLDAKRRSALMSLQADSAILDQSQREALLNELGYDRKKASSKVNTHQRAQVTSFHERVRQSFKQLESPEDMSADDIQGRIEKAGPELKYLFAKGRAGKTLLHLLLTPESEETPAVFDRFKPLIRFLLKACPDFPKMTDKDDEAPLFSTMKPEIDDAGLKAHIVRFLCSARNVDSLGSSAAIESLGMKEKGSKSHALHLAIQEHVTIDKEIVASKILIPRLAIKAGDGMTCLHKAMTLPYSDSKRHWAKMLVEIDCKLLGIRSEIREEVDEDDTSDETLNRQLTALQLLAETKRKEQDDEEAEEDDKERLRRQAWPASTSLKHNHKTDHYAAPESIKIGEGPQIISSPITDRPLEIPGKSKLCRSRTEDIQRPRVRRIDGWNDLESWLKHYCLTNFDNATVRNMIYRPDEMRQIDFSCYEKGDVVSRALLSKMNVHYRLDSMLRCVHIPSVTVDWSEDKVKPKVDGWGCVGRTDYYMIFDWLRNEVKVEKIIKIVVEDFEDGLKSHPDEVIVQCLRSLGVEIWNWQRMDISSEVIRRAAGESVTEVFLFCSGNNAVLRGWSDENGLVKLNQLRTVHLQVHQGLDSLKVVERYISDFRKDLKELFRRQGREIDIKTRVIQPAICEISSDKAGMSSIKEKDEAGYEEQEWLKCVDRFVDFIDDLEADETDGVEFDQHQSQVKVCLIDDGVKSQHAGLDDNIACGESWARPRVNQDSHSPYTTSVKGHGTVMAYYIRRLCPKVRLYVAKLDPYTSPGRFSFTMDNAAKAIEWAVDNNVNIISMSWAIEPIAFTGSANEEADRLKSAIQKAAAKRILMFCALSDRGGRENVGTYPKSLAEGDIFSIGAASKDGHPWPRTGDEKADYYLPGVELGIPVEHIDGRKTGQPPEKWHIYNGSSLSCALAAGLAALVFHCTRLVRPGQLFYLQQVAGMKAAFKNIGVSDRGWIHVNTLFGDSSIRKAIGGQSKIDIVRHIVEKILSDMSYEQKKTDIA